MCQPGLTVANYFVNGGKCLTEKIVPSLQAWIVGSGIIRPDTNAQHWAWRDGISHLCIASAQKEMFHGGVLREFGVVAR